MHALSLQPEGRYVGLHLVISVADVRVVGAEVCALIRNVGGRRWKRGRRCGRRLRRAGCRYVCGALGSEKFML